jgi:hypothetical protein
MATARTAQTHDKRVQKIADEAAAKIADDSPFEEEVVVVVEELPPGERTRTQRGRSTNTEEEPATAMFSTLGQSQKLIADGISRWTELAAPFANGRTSTDLFGSLFDPRHMTLEAFRLAEELVALQKDFTLKLVDAMTPARAA